MQRVEFLNDLHINIVQAINMVMKLPERQIHFFEEIRKRNIEKPKDYELMLSYGFLRYYEITHIIQGEDLANTGILDVVKIYDEILEIRPNDWFVRLLKILLYIKLPQKMRKEEDFKTTIRWMLEAQSKSIKKESYFILPYIYYSEYWYEKKDMALAKKYLDDGLKQVPLKPINYLYFNPHIFIPIKEFYYCLYRSEDFELAKSIKTISSIYFPLESKAMNQFSNSIL
ncbi:hypothetical protein [Clostridium sp. Cult1]|uniref:hypothetical protein n=1 Tax=Clostridium sp. Cult1 TaxID=2079002 RepID=UPI001F2D2BF8|nr:hypothetical protein [Clostridium sp. Cult1]MCF6462806.1 hypothetical protein [Clostridium sp. Cult1]